MFFHALILLLLHTSINAEICPSSSLPYGKFCYSFSDEEVSYKSAMDICSEGGGQLVTILDQKTNLFLKKFFLWGIATGYWIGVTGDTVKENWIYQSDKSNVSFTSWGKGQPNTLYSLNCVALLFSNGFEWMDDNCDIKKFFVCEFNDAESICSDNRFKLGNKCYLLSRVILHYEDAQDYCKKRKGILAEIKSSEEMEFIKYALMRERWWYSTQSEVLEIPGTRYYHFWLGIRRSDKNNSVWLDTKSNPISFESWMEREPNNIYKKCAVISPNGWLDWDCDWNTDFICQYQRTTNFTESEIPDDSGTFENSNNFYGNLGGGSKKKEENANQTYNTYQMVTLISVGAAAAIIATSSCFVMGILLYKRYK